MPSELRISKVASFEFPHQLPAHYHPALVLGQQLQDSFSISPTIIPEDLLDRIVSPKIVTKEGPVVWLIEHRSLSPGAEPAEIFTLLRV